MADTDVATALWGEIVEGVPYPMSQEEFERRYLGEKGIELVEGRVIRNVANTRLHTLVATRLLLALAAYAQQYGGFQAFGADNTYKLSIPGKATPIDLEPDASLVALAKLPAFDNLLAWNSIPDTAPDLAAEIASKGQTTAKMGVKVGYFLAAGTRLAWVIYPLERRAEMWRSGERQPTRLGYADALSGLDVAPGLSVPLRALC